MTFDEAVNFTLNNLNKYYDRDISSTTKFDTNLRNELKLWYENELTGYFNSIGIFHADDMSEILLNAAIKKKHNEYFDLNKELKKYWKHWIYKNLYNDCINNPDNVGKKTIDFLINKEPYTNNINLELLNDRISDNGFLARKLNNGYSYYSDVENVININKLNEILDKCKINTNLKSEKELKDLLKHIQTEKELVERLLNDSKIQSISDAYITNLKFLELFEEILNLIGVN